MSGQSQNWTIPTDALGVMQAQEKRLQTEERRPRITKASELLGPGYAPYAVPLDDPNNENAAFNGLWHLPVGAPNSPDDTKNWLGHTIATALDGGVQVFWTYETADAPHSEMMRSFQIAGGTRFYTDWQEAGGGVEEPTTSPVVQTGEKSITPTTIGEWKSATVVFDETFSVVPQVVTDLSSSTTSSATIETRHSDVTVNGCLVWLRQTTNLTPRTVEWIAAIPFSAVLP